MDLLAAADTSGVVQYGPVVAGAVALIGPVWAIIKFLFNRIEKSHSAEITHLTESIAAERARAERAELRADQYERELKDTVASWQEDIAPIMKATGRALEVVTDNLRLDGGDRDRGAGWHRKTR